MLSLGVVRASMIVATVMWALGEALMRRSPAADRAARAFWTAGIACAAVHVVLAFEVAYAWNHEAAVEATVRQAADVFGRGWRGGIYVNYVFLATWLADIVWWWAAPASRASRPRAVEAVRVMFFLFMFLNGAVIFASGAGRLVGVLSLGLVVAAMIKRGGVVA